MRVSETIISDLSLNLIAISRHLRYSVTVYFEALDAVAAVTTLADKYYPGVGKILATGRVTRAVQLVRYYNGR